MTVISLVQSNIVRSHSSAYKKEISQKNKARRLLAIVLIVSMAVVIFFYILQVNTIASNGYKIRELKSRLRELEDSNRTFQVTISNLKSIDVLQSKTKNLYMTQAQNIEYVNISSTNVGVAK